MKGGKRTGREGGHIEVYSYFFPFTQLLHMCKLSRFSCVRLFVTLWVVGSQAPLSMGFSRQEHWSGLPFPSLLISIVDVFSPFIFHIIIDILWPRSDIHCLFSVFSLCILFITFILAFLWVRILFDF